MEPKGLCLFSFIGFEAFSVCDFVCVPVDMWMCYLVLTWLLRNHSATASKVHCVQIGPYEVKLRQGFSEANKNGRENFHDDLIVFCFL